MRSGVQLDGAGDTARSNISWTAHDACHARKITREQTAPPNQRATASAVSAQERIASDKQLYRLHPCHGCVNQDIKTVTPRVFQGSLPTNPTPFDLRKLSQRPTMRLYVVVEQQRFADQSAPVYSAE